MDVHSRAIRSKNMAAIRNRDTVAELLVRRELRAAGYPGYRVKSRLPGRPDITFSRQRVAIFVDGCFWHGCPRCYRKPVTNSTFWADKLKANLARDERVAADLKASGWTVFRLWEHDVKADPEKAIRRATMALRRR